MATAITLIFIATLIGLAVDAKANDTHALSVRRLYRRIRKVQKANDQTRLDSIYYSQQTYK